MRIIRLKLTDASKVYAEQIAHRLSVSDTSFIEDLYCVIRLRGTNMPKDADIEDLAQKYAKLAKASLLVSRVMCKKRRQLLNDIAKTGMFKAHCKNPIENDFEFCERLLVAFRMLHHKLRQSECISCSLLTKCAFGQQYAASVRRIDAVIDPDYRKKVHQDCPSYPEIELTNEVQKAAQFISNVATPHGGNALRAAVKNAPGPHSGVPPAHAAEVSAAVDGEAEAQSEDEDGDGEIDEDAVLSAIDLEEVSDDDVLHMLEQAKVTKGSRSNTTYMSKHAGGQLVVVDDKVIEKLRVTDLVIYELARKLDDLLSKQKKGIFKPVEQLTKQRKQAQIKSISDVTKVVASQNALPDDVFERKLAKKELVKHQQEEKESKKQLLYVLLDTSGSMTSGAGMSSTFGFITRAALAASFSIALARRIKDDEGILFMRCFEGGPDRLHSARKANEFEDLEKYIIGCAFNGYSTNIPAALETAFADIKASQDELARSEVLMITDAGDVMDASVVAAMRRALGATSLNILDVSGDPASSSMKTSNSAAQGLAQLADNYYSIDTNKTLDKMVNLIGGKKKKA